MASGGISNSASDVVFSLRRDTAALTELLGKNDQDRSMTEAKAKDIEGHLMTLQVLGQISDKYCGDLINQLHVIVNK